VIESQILLIEDENRRLAVAKTFELVQTNEIYIKSSEDAVMIFYGRMDDLVSLNIRLRMELDLDTCVVPIDLISEVFGDRSSTKNTVIKLGSGELFAIDR
jgi:hypothetical protein